jgi:pentapeptide MXKDX repeat protein
MKKISYVLAALATIAIAVPSIASAEDKPMMKEGMKDEGMKKPMMHHHHYHYHHHHHHHMKETMKKEGM